MRKHPFLWAVSLLALYLIIGMFHAVYFRKHNPSELPVTGSVAGAITFAWPIADILVIANTIIP